MLVNYQGGNDLHQENASVTPSAPAFHLDLTSTTTTTMTQMVFVWLLQICKYLCTGSSIKQLLFVYNKAHAFCFCMKNNSDYL